MTDSGLLTLSQWLSPSFPLGGFAYSHGLEAAISDGMTDPAEIERWLSDVLQVGSGRSDAVILCAAMAKDADHHRLSATARALASSRERWEETYSQGVAFTETVNALLGATYPPTALPVAVGRATRRLGLPPEQVVALYLQAFVANLALAAVRFVPLGQTEGQAIVQALQPVVLGVAAAAAKTPVDAITTSVPGADLSAMAHEVLEVRIFRT